MKKLLLLTIVLFSAINTFAQTIPLTVSYRGNTPVNSKDTIAYTYPGKIGGYSWLYNTEYIRANFAPITGGAYKLKSDSTGAAGYQTVGNFYPKGDIRYVTRALRNTTYGFDFRGGSLPTGTALQNPDGLTVSYSAAGVTLSGMFNSLNDYILDTQVTNLKTQSISYTFLAGALTDVFIGQYGSYFDFGRFRGGTSNKIEHITNYGVVQSSSKGLYYQTGDSLRMTYTLTIGYATTTITNLSRVTPSISDTYYFNTTYGVTPTGNIPSSGRMAFGLINGSVTLRTWTVNKPQADIVWQVDSEGSGFWATSSTLAYPGLLGGNFALQGGPGNQTSNGIDCLPELYTLRPKYGIINWGVNNATAGFVSDVSMIASGMVAHGITPIILNVLPVYARADTMNLALKTAFTGVYKIVDINTIVRDSLTGLFNTTYTDDGVHPNIAGHRLIATTIKQQLPEIFGKSQLNGGGVVGTANRITVSGTPSAIDISPTFEALLGKVANPLSQFAATTSAQLAAVLTNETGTGSVVFSASPTLSGTTTVATMAASGVRTQTGTSVGSASARWFGSNGGTGGYWNTPSGTQNIIGVNNTDVLLVNGSGVNLNGTFVFNTLPTTSAGGYYIPTINSSTQAVEKVLSSTYLLSSGFTTSAINSLYGYTPANPANFVDLTTAQSIQGNKILVDNTTFNGNLEIKNGQAGIKLWDASNSFYIQFSAGPTSNRTITLPNATGSATVTNNGSGAPVSTPTAIGMFYVDTTNSKLYFSKGTSSSADWIIAN